MTLQDTPPAVAGKTPPDWHSVKLSHGAYQALLLIRQYVHQRGLGVIPEGLRERAGLAQFTGFQVGELLTLAIAALDDSLTPPRVAKPARPAAAKKHAAKKPARKPAKKGGRR